MKCACITAAVLAARVAALAAAAPEPADEVGATPWHLVDFWWHFEDQPVLESYEIDVEIRGEIDPAIRLYVGAVGIASLDKINFYGGLQTQSDGFREYPHGKRAYIGPGAIFSRWDTRDIGAVRKMEDGLFESGGYEGQFVSARRPLRWSAGRYTYAIRRLETETTAGRTNTWFGAFVRPAGTNTEIRVGALRFEGMDLEFGRAAASFVEIYGARIPLEKIPRITVLLGPWRINGKPVTPARAEALYPRDVPQWAKSRPEDGRVAVELVGPIDRPAQEGVDRLKGAWRQSLWTAPPAPERKAVAESKQRDGS